MISALFFYGFAAMTLASAIMVVATRNPVHAVFFLILSFFSAAGLFVLMGAEFIAMLLVVVYVGAVAVLMLFVVMMLDIDVSVLRAKGSLRRHMPLAGVLGAVLLAELGLILWGEAESNAVGVAPVSGTRSNIERIGDVLYIDHIFVFQTAGVILLVAMIGAITLTMRQREGVKRQDIMTQTMRRRNESVAIVSIPAGATPHAIGMQADMQEIMKETGGGTAVGAGKKSVASARQRRIRKRRGRRGDV